jgi:hypothetical protein
LIVLDPVSEVGFVGPLDIVHSEPNNFEQQQRLSINALTPQLCMLMVALVLNNAAREAFSYAQAHSYYNTYAEQFNLHKESFDMIKSEVNNLLDYCVISRVNKVTSYNA